MSYTKTNWRDKHEPDINALALNNIETGIKNNESEIGNVRKVASDALTVAQHNSQSIDGIDNSLRSVNQEIVAIKDLLVISDGKIVKLDTDVQDINDSIRGIEGDIESIRAELGSGETADENIWKYYYYADPLLNRTVIVDPISMKLIGWVPTIADGHPGSTDRAGYTNRAYVRTGGPSSKRLHTYDVIDAKTKQFIQSIHLPDPDFPDDETKGLVPRGCGTYNKYQNLQIISHKKEPMCTVIDVRTDRPAAPAVGSKKTQGMFLEANYDNDHGPSQNLIIDANWDGNATGHSNWLDSNHFTLLDRYRNQIIIFRIEEDNEQLGKYTITKTHTEQLPMCSHVIDEDVQDQTLSRTKYWSAIEGSKSQDVAPHIREFLYANGSGFFRKGKIANLPGIDSSDQVHHYGYWPKFKELWVPLWVSKKTFVIDVGDDPVTNMNVLNGYGYDTGLGGAHVNFSDRYDLAIITNHFDTDVQIIDRSGNITSVTVTSTKDTTVPRIGYWRQSHINHVTPDGKFFHLFAIQDGTFVEIDLYTKKVSRRLFTGGHPEQSSS